LREPGWLTVHLLAAAAVMSGCHGGVVSDTEFRQQLSLSVASINSGDLEAARAQLRDARAAAAAPAQVRKVDSLEQLIDGAEALRAGDLDGARAAWSRIQEPQLGREVRHKARLIGVEVPMVPGEGEVTR
jgi:hypothetical protein